MGNYSPFTLRGARGLILVLVLFIAAPGFAALVETIIGTKNSKVYHTHPTECSAARRIGSENRITFASVQEAEQSGRRLCKSCAGLDKRPTDDDGVCCVRR